MKSVISGASGDIGRAIARAFAKRGDSLALLYHTGEETINTLVKEIAPFGGMIVAKKVDLADAVQIERVLSELKKEFGAPDVLVNAAGVSIVAPVFDTTAEAWDKVFAINTRAVFLLSKWAAENMIDGGRIINISSIWGSHPAPCEAAYASSKAAVESFTKSFAKEVGSLGVTVNSIAAGLIDTNMNARFTLAEKAEFTEGLAVKRMCTPEDVSHAALFLSDPASSYISGAVLPVDGGY